MTRLPFLPLILTVLSGAAPRPDAPAADLALSASFLPPRYIVADPDQRERVRGFLRALPRDSSERFLLEGSVLKLSHELAERLAAEEGGEERGKSRRRARLRLERAAGPGIEEDAPAFPAGYFPDDFALQSTPQWGLHNDGSLGGSVPGVDVNMPRVWEQFDGSDTLVIAVLDAGLNFRHPDLQGRWFVNQAEADGLPGVDDDGNGFVDDVHGWDFVDGDNDPQDYHGHGTMMSGIIAAGFDNGIGMAGMLPRARILPVRVLSAAGFGNITHIANGIRYAAAMGAHAVNFSIGIGGSVINPNLQNAFIAARDSGVLIAAAAANDALDLNANPRQPASYKLANVYVVASHTHGGGLSGFSNYGDTMVDLAAPGEYIMTTTIPPAILLFHETFEDFDSAVWTISPAGGFAVRPDSMQGAHSLKWITGNNVTALTDSLDLRERNGAVLRFALHFQRAGASDILHVEVQPVSGGAWISLAAINGAVSGQTLAYNLKPVEGSLFRLRFRTAATGSTANRVLRIDDVRVDYADESPENQAAFLQTGGTSVAAPYVAGYAGLMRLATDRAGLQLTRARMLEGTVPEPALAGKVITGGRLDVAKGLDFYLQTLPRITVSDTADTAWSQGASVAYSLSVADSSGPRKDFAFSAITAPPGGTLTPEGLFSWSSAGATNGDYVLRAVAESPPLALRAMVRFTLVEPVPVAPAVPGRESLLRIGNRAFLLPPSAFARDRHALRIEFYGADGRTLRTVTGELAMPPGARGAEYRLEGFRGAGLRAWLNGSPLRPAPRD